MADRYSVVCFESSSPGIVLLQGSLRYINDRKLIRDRPWKTGQLLNVFRNPGEAATTVLEAKAGY